MEKCALLGGLQQGGAIVGQEVSSVRFGFCVRRGNGRRKKKSWWEGGRRIVLSVWSRQGKEGEEGVRHAFSLNSHALDSATPARQLSPAAIHVIQQFARMNGLTASKMRANFEAIAPAGIQNDATNLVEFCCFRYLVRSGTEFHPGIKDPCFRRLSFTAMLAWQCPYVDVAQSAACAHLTANGVVGEEAFVRIAPAIAGAADRPTAHHLFQALVQDEQGLSLSVWDKYLSELQAVHEGREARRQQEWSTTLGLAGGERVICVGASRRQAVQLWSKKLAWPGRLTLTDRALYFQGNALTGHKKPTKLDLTQESVRVELRKVGPFGAPIFDSAVAVFASGRSDPWVVEFADFGGESRRDMWFAVMKEIICLHRFTREYGPATDDPCLHTVYGSRNGGRKATKSAVEGIARLQALQATLGKMPAYPARLLQFSYLAKVPSGDLVLQSLAVELWAGRMDGKAGKRWDAAADGNAMQLGPPIINIDGNVYLRKWMTSPSWSTSKAIAFWKSRGTKGLVFGKNHVVGGFTSVERAVQICREQSHAVERTKATVDGAMLKGIPDNIDLLKELVMPLALALQHLQKLKRWENPAMTVVFLGSIQGLLYRDWFRFVFPAMLLLSAAWIMAIRYVKQQGHLGQDHGKVTILEQPPSNTLQQIVALKEALSSLESFLQHLNIALLKLRTLGTCGQAKASNLVVLGLVGLSVTLLLLPFRFLFALFLLDQFTNELEFRRQDVKKMLQMASDWWETVPASPVMVLPRPKDSQGATLSLAPPAPEDGVVQAVREWLEEPEHAP